MAPDDSVRTSTRFDDTSIEPDATSVVVVVDADALIALISGAAVGAEETASELLDSESGMAALM